LRINTGPIVPLLCVVLVLSMISIQPRAWKAWAASFGAAALLSLLDWGFSLEGISRIIVSVVFVASNVYAFFEFRRLLKSSETVQSAAGGTD